MERITIHSGLDEFVLIDAIAALDDINIFATASFSDAPIYQGIESLAQLGAMHVRYLVRFEKHAFLLKINHFSIKLATIGKMGHLSGQYYLSGNRMAASGKAYSYTFQAEKEGFIHFQGDFLFATTEYNEAFNREKLESHYKKVFACLQNG